jgi:tRNA wybutosine-synthesizing protein 4
MSDSSIISTADDAIGAKYAAVQAGYYKDPFLATLLPMKYQMRPSQPLIRRGTHARVMCMDRVIKTFIATRENPHIVMLGSGKDTTFFRYTSGYFQDPVPATTIDDETSSIKRVTWYEVDHPSMIQTKASKVRQHEAIFKSKVTPHSSGGFTVTKHNSQCHLVGHDLRDAPADFLDKLSQHGLNPSSDSILFVSECVQMYLIETASQNLWIHLRQTCPDACLALFDPIVGHSGNSRFGGMMEQNLLRLGVVTRDSSVLQTRTLSKHLEKLVTLSGWAQAVGCDMWSAYHTLMTAEQRQQATEVEVLDEVEEWRLIMQHYCLVVACTSERGLEFCSSPLLGFDPSKSTAKTKGEETT